MRVPFNWLYVGSVVSVWRIGASRHSHGQLGISRATVIFYAQEVFYKLGVARRAEPQANLMAL